MLAVCGLVLLTGAVVLWLAHRSARAGTEALTGSVFREVSGRAAAHTRGYVLRAVIRATAARPAAEISKAILDSLVAFRGACRPADDVTFVVVKVEGSPLVQKP